MLQKVCDNYEVLSLITRMDFITVEKYTNIGKYYQYSFSNFTIKLLLNDIDNCQLHIKYETLEYVYAIYYYMIIKIDVIIHMCKELIDLFYESIHIYKYFAKLLL